MKAPLFPLLRTCALVLLVLAGSHSSQAGTLGPGTPPIQVGPVRHYTLLSGSYLQDDCLICGRPTVQDPMTGSFDLRLVASNVLSSRFRIENIHFTAGPSFGRTYTVSGQGSFEIGGEVAVIQNVSLTVDIDDGTNKIPCTLKSDAGPPPRAFPMLDATVEQTNGTLTQTFTLRLAAAPMQDVWFSPGRFFTAGAGPESGKFLEGGDLLSLSGHRVKTNANLYGSIGATPPGPDLGLDAVDILPGGEIAFSMDIGFPMTNVGPVHHGDLLSTKGRIIQRNGDLLAAFGLQPIAPDAGLDAVRVLDSGEVLFSIESEVFSEKLGTQLHSGDILSSNGSVFRTYSKLYEKFVTLTPPADYGLDSLYLWPSGEIWFSPEIAFSENHLGRIVPGDLLSDQGYLVFRNRHLLSAFSPVQTDEDFGLDALFIITDLTAPPGPPLLSMIRKPGTPGVTLNWQSPARVFQVERSTSLGLFEPIGPIIPDRSWVDPFEGPRAFYRLRQW